MDLKFACSEALGETHFKLIEAVADHVCETLFLQDARVEAVTVKIVKLALSEADERSASRCTASGGDVHNHPDRQSARPPARCCGRIPCHPSSQDTARHPRRAEVEPCAGVRVRWARAPRLAPSGIQDWLVNWRRCE
jgi:hypothetical protein